jgi:hypothetical protein
LRCCRYAISLAAENFISIFPWIECHLGGYLAAIDFLGAYGAARSRALSKPGGGPSFSAACWKKKELTAFTQQGSPRLRSQTVEGTIFFCG